MTNIDFLVQNSAKKILSLIKGLPDEKKLAAAFTVPDSESSSSRPPRFTRHPRHCEDVMGGVIDENDNDDTSASTIKDEIVTTASCKNHENLGAHLHRDSSDEFCDVTVRTEDVTTCSRDLEDSIDPYQCDSFAFSPMMRKSKTKNKGSGKQYPLSKIRSITDYERVIKKIEKKVRKSKAREPKRRKGSSTPASAPQTARRDETSSMNMPTSIESIEEPLVESNTDSIERKHTHSLSEPIKQIRIDIEPKIKSMMERILNTLLECRSIFVDGIEPPDGRLDYEKRMKRDTAFSSRFSRNYLYQLVINKVEIENIINPFGKTRKTNSYILGHRFFNAFQTIYLAMDAYKKHLTTGVLNGLPSKFRELLDIILKFIDLLRPFIDPPSNVETVVDTLTNCCKTMLADKALEYSTKVALSNMSFAHKRRKAVKAMTFSQRIQKRLSMYASATQPKPKYQVPSRYKTATFKHRPPPPPQPTPKSANNKFRRRKKPYVEPLELGNSSDTVVQKKNNYSRKLDVKDIDSDVYTFVEGTAFEQMDGLDYFNDCKNLRRIAGQFYRKVIKKDQEMSTQEYICILDHFMEFIGEKILPNGAEKAKIAQEKLEKSFGRDIDNIKFEEFVGTLITIANERHGKAGSHHHGPPPAPASTPNLSPHEYTPRAASPSSKSVQSQKLNICSDMHFKSRMKTLSMTGPDNAKLICLKEETIPEEDDNISSQIHELDPEGALQKKLSRMSMCQQQQEGNELIYKVCDDDEKAFIPSKLDKISSRQLRQADKEDVEENCEKCHEKKGDKKKAKQKAVPVLESLPRDMMMRLIEYKLHFHNNSKDNVIYKKTADFTTWFFVSKVADSLMDDALLSVTRDIQVDKILKKIYDQEFK